MRRVQSAESRLFTFRHPSNEPGPARFASAGRGAFTLIELMIVIAIIAVLVSVAVPQYKKVREDSQRRACFENQRKIAGAIEQFNLDQNKSVTEVTPDFLVNLVAKKFLLSDPVCPTAGKSSVYQIQLVSGDQSSISCSVHGRSNAPPAAAPVAPPTP